LGTTDVMVFYRLTLIYKSLKPVRGRFGGQSPEVMIVERKNNKELFCSNIAVCLMKKWGILREKMVMKSK
jgi:hypothetical protein